MQDTVNNVLKILESTYSKVTEDLYIKTKNVKHAIKFQDYYKNNLSLFENINLGAFESALRQINLEKLQKKPVDLASFDTLLKSCWFIDEKFRWHVTSKRVKVFYERLNFDYINKYFPTNEYFNLGSDSNSSIFFDAVCANTGELTLLNELVDKYNILNAGQQGFEKTTNEKVVKAIITDMKGRQYYKLLQEPVVLTNDKNEAAYAYFDIDSRKLKGDAYILEQQKINPNGNWDTWRPPTPAWDEFCERIENQDMVPIFKAVIAGIFVGKTETKQILYLYGEGDDGKSEIVKIIMAFLGKELCFTLDQHLHMNQFSSYDAVGKRLCIGEELNASNALKHSAIKALSGSSPIRVEPKGEKAFTIEPKVCIVLTSNEYARIKDVRNQLSRLIFISLKSCDIEKVNKEGSVWKKNLKEEFESFLYDGLKWYDILNPEGKSYALPLSHSKEIENLFDEETNTLEEFFKTCFEPCPFTYMRSKLSEALLSFVVRDKEDRKYDLIQEYKKINENKLYSMLKKFFPGVSRGHLVYFEGKQFRAFHGVKLSAEGRDLHYSLNPQTKIS